MKRGLIIGTVCVLVALLAVVVVVLLNAGSIVKKMVERVGTDTAGTTVTLAAAEVSVTSGKGILRGLTVGNPPGFMSDYAIRLGEVEIALDVGSLHVPRLGRGLRREELARRRVRPPRLAAGGGPAGRHGALLHGRVRLRARAGPLSQPAPPRYSRPTSRSSSSSDLIDEARTQVGRISAP